MNNPDHISESLETIFWVKKILKFFEADQGWKKYGSGNQDKHPGSATLLENIQIAVLWNWNHNFLPWRNGSDTYCIPVLFPNLVPDPDLNPDPDPT
jgi:hypothetical protein